MPKGAEDPTFALGYSLLHAYFGPLGEIERRGVIAGWADHPRRRLGPYEVRYRMVVAWDGERPAGARDCYAILDPEAGACVVYLAHAWVAPEARRGGLATVFRTVPATLGRELIEEARLDPRTTPLLLAVEQDAVRPEDRDSHVRLCAYGKGGFCAIDPAALPYCQPDLRDLEGSDEAARPLPMLLNVRWVGNEDRRQLPAWLAAAAARHTYAIFATHCRPGDLAPALDHALATLRATGRDAVDLLPLPRHPDEAPARPEIGRENVLRYFPRALYDPDPR